MTRRSKVAVLAVAALLPTLAGCAAGTEDDDAVRNGAEGARGDSVDQAASRPGEAAGGSGARVGGSATVEFSRGGSSDVRAAPELGGVHRRAGAQGHVL